MNASANNSIALDYNSAKQTLMQRNDFLNKTNTLEAINSQFQNVICKEESAITFSKGPSFDSCQVIVQEEPSISNNSYL